MTDPSLTPPPPPQQPQPQPQPTPASSAPSPAPHPRKPHSAPHPRHDSHRSGDDEKFFTADVSALHQPVLLSPRNESLLTRLILAPLLAFTFLLSLILTDRRASSSSSSQRPSPPHPPPPTTLSRIKSFFSPSAPSSSSSSSSSQPSSTAQIPYLHTRVRQTARRELQDAWDGRANVLVGVVMLVGVVVAGGVAGVVWVWSVWGRGAWRGVWR